MNDWKKREERPKSIQGDLHNLPPALAPLIDLPHWVLWRWEKPKDKFTKVPYQPNGHKAKNNDAKTWNSYDAVIAAMAIPKPKFDGIGFCLLDGNIAAFDIDDCRDPDTGEIDPWASDLVQRAGSYAEITVSGTGLRIIGYGEGKRLQRKLTVHNGVSLEAYRRAERYIVITSNPLPDAKDLINIDKSLDDTVAELEAKKTQEEPTKPGTPDDGGHHARQEPDEDDDRLERIVRDGPKSDTEFNSKRSGAVWWAINEMLRRGYLEQTIESTLLDRANKISTHIYDQPNPRAYVKKQIADAKKGINLQDELELPEVLDAGDDLTKPPPRAWLYGNIFARKFLSSLFGDGGAGKTALRCAEYMSMAANKDLLGEHIFQRCRVLIVSLEDDIDELRRRIWALRIHYGITPEQLKGYLHLWAPGAAAGKLMHLDKRGNPVVGKLRAHLEAMINAHKIDFVGIDPFIKSHGVGENNNTAIDMVVQVLVDLSHKLNIGIDVPHHVSKAPRNGGGVEPGDADRGRGASAMKDAFRIVHTLNVMTKEEAKQFGINEEDRWAYVRMDKAKVNIVPPSRQAKWFHLVGVPIGNETEMYPHGDEVQAMERWTPPDVMGGLSNADMGEILARIDKGMGDGRRYSDAPTAKARAAWKVVVEVCPDVNEVQARDIIKTWVKKGVLVSNSYRNEKDRKEEDGLWRGGTIEIPFQAQR